MSAISLSKNQMGESFSISVLCRKLRREKTDHTDNPRFQGAQGEHFNEKKKPKT